MFEALHETDDGSFVAVRRSKRRRLGLDLKYKLSNNTKYLFAHNHGDDSSDNHNSDESDCVSIDDPTTTTTTAAHNTNETNESKPTIIRMGGRNLELLHSNPNVYLIRNFLTKREIAHLSNLAQTRKEDFKNSYTNDTSTNKVYSKERTSKFVFLSKAEDHITRIIEQRAADIVSMPVADVEPLQIVRYTEGQKFTLHHDSGTLIDTSENKPIHEYVTPDQDRPLDYDSDFQLDWGTYHSTHTSTSPSSHASIDDNNDSSDEEYNPNQSHSQSSKKSKNKLPKKSKKSQIRKKRPKKRKLETDIEEDIITEVELISDSSEYENEESTMPMPIASVSNSNSGEDSNEVIDLTSNNGDCCDSGDDESVFKRIKQKRNRDYAVKLVTPRRMVSFFVYLNSLPSDAGGETVFPQLGLAVRPEAGCAVLWFNMDPHNTAACDVRLIHKAKPVKGRGHFKMGMNIWVTDGNFHKTSSY